MAFSTVYGVVGGLFNHGLLNPDFSTQTIQPQIIQPLECQNQGLLKWPEQSGVEIFTKGLNNPGSNNPSTSGPNIFGRLYVC